MISTDKEPYSDDISNKVEPSTQPQIIETEPEQFYHQEKYRWVIIVLVSIAFTINNLANNAIIPIASKVATLYQLSQTYANLPIQVSFLINPIMNFTAGHFIDSRGLGVSFRIGSILYAVGLLGFCFINYGYHWVLIGAILISLGQPLIMNCPAKVATFWFVSKNRTLATGIISAINLVTLGVSLVFPAIFVDQDSVGDQAKDQIFSLYSKYFLAAVANCVLVIFFMRQKPQRLPSAGAQQEKTSISKTIEIIRADTNIWKFFIAAILLYGTFLSFGSTSNMLFKPYGFGNTQIAIFGVCLIVSGVLGSVAYTLYIKKTIKYRAAIVCACVLALSFIATNALLMNFATEQKVLISIMILGMGFNLIPMVPISYDLGCQLTFPVGEAQVVGIVTGGAMIYAVVLTLTITAAVGFQTPNKSGICMCIYIALFLLGAILYCTVKINLKRRDHEKMKEDEKKNGQYINNFTIQDSAKDVNLIHPLNSRRKSQSQQVLRVKDDSDNNSIISEQKSQSGQQNSESGQQYLQKQQNRKSKPTKANPKGIKIGSSSKTHIKQSQLIEQQSKQQSQQ